MGSIWALYGFVKKEDENKFLRGLYSLDGVVVWNWCYENSLKVVLYV